MLRTITTFFLLIWAAVSFGQAEMLNKYLDIQHKRLGFHGAVLITKNNRELYRANIGKASIELDVPVNAASIFKVASISKQFTAMLVMLASEEGRLQLTDTLGSFFPQLKDTSWRRINLHQLLSHSSGIAHNEGIKDYWISKSRLPLSKQEALQEIFSMKLLFEPGTNMKYSSPGYFLLACVLESVYNRAYELILQEKILHPLQLKHSGIYVSGKIVPGMVSTYHQLSDSLVSPFRDFSLMKGSGDLFSSAEDLSTWNNSFSDNKVWSKNIQQSLFTVQSKQQPYYGYGWYIRPGKRLAYYHGGGTFGTSALSAWYPNEELSVVILSNVSVLPVNDIWSDIEKIIFNEPFQLPSILSTIEMTAAEMQTFTGTYEGGGQYLEILIIGNRLYAKLAGKPPFEIYPEARLQFSAKKVNVIFTFEAGPGGKILRLTAKAGEVTHYFNKR
jgi:CubicO group peptidase (beta-lactamase class C family)